MRTSFPETHEEKLAQLRELREQAVHSASEDAVEKQHAKGKLTARERIEKLLDPGSLRGARHLRPPPHPRLRHAEAAAVGRRRGHRLGHDRRPAGLRSSRRTSRSSAARSARSWARRCARSWTSPPRSAARSSASTTPAARASRRAWCRWAPTATSSCATCSAPGVIPQISLIMGPCAGGAVYSPAMTDFIFMVKETSHMFITGPDVIKTVTGEEVEFEELGGAMAHNSKSGVAHFAAEDEESCLEDARYLMCFLPQNNLELPPRIEPDDDPERDGRGARHVVPDDPSKPYDMRDVISLIVDDGEFFEVQEHFAQNIVVGFSRLDGDRSASWATSPSTSPACSTSTPPRRPRASCASATPSTSRCSPSRTCPASCPAPRRSGAASSATGRSCCTPSPRRRCRSSPSSRARPTAAPTTS